MTGISETAEHWFGLCRRPPAVHPLQTGIDIRLESDHEGPPGGGSDGSRAIHRGIGAALSGMKTLNRNRQFLWFTLLSGCVMAGNSIYQAVLNYIGWNMHMQLDIIVLYALDFLIEFGTLFCLVILLAGLVLSISSKKEDSASFFWGLSGTKKYFKEIFVWSFILALAGMLLIRIYIFLTVFCVSSCSFLNIFGFSIIPGILTQFPFNWTLDWNMFTELPGYGGRSLLLWIYPFGFMEALPISAINLLLFILTPFIVPLIVLEQKTLREAVVGSFGMMKTTLIEGIACVVFLGVLVLGVFLTYLLVQTASGMVSPYETVTHHPADTWIALGFLYDLALLIFVFVVATIGGIAAFDLYASSKSGQKPEFLDPVLHS